MENEPRDGVLLSGPYDMKVDAEAEMCMAAMRQLGPIECWLHKTDEGTFLYRTRSGARNWDLFRKENHRSYLKLKGRL